jgi:capsid protein
MATKPIKAFTNRAKRAFLYTFFGNDSVYPTASTSAQRNAQGDMNGDLLNLMSRHKTLLLRSDSRYIYTSNSTVNGAVKQRAGKVYGESWRFQSHSTDADFVAKVEADMKAIDGLIDIRGSQYSFRRNVKIESKSIDVDGDFFVLLTESKSGFPRLQWIEAHRIGCSLYDNEDRVVGGKYRGLKIKSGIIYNEFGAEVAYRVMGEDQESFRDISARDMIHVSDPDWFSQGRGVPAIASGMLDWYDLAEVRDYEKIGQKVNSAITLKESNESGRRDTANQIIQGQRGAEQVPFQTELMAGGTIRYLKNSSKLESHESNRPSDGFLKFTDKIEAGAFYGMGWRREMLDSSAVGGAGVRAFQRDINDSINDRVECLGRFRKRMALYIIAKRAKQGIYDLPDDWMECSFTKPREFTVDDGNSRKADREDVRAGLSSVPEILAKRGYDPIEFTRKNAEFLKQREAIAAEFDIDPVLLGTSLMPGDVVSEQLNETQQLDT